MKHDELHYADVHHAKINTLLNHPITYQNLAAARADFERLRRHYHLSNDELADPEHTLRLWIEGFDFSPDDLAKGRLGNWADLSINEQPNGKCTITFKKVERDMEFDPFKPRVKHTHPDWGWPLMRHIKSRKKYRFIEDAQGALKRYHEDFPAITRVRDKNSLYTIIWSDHYKPKPTRNFVLEVVEDGDCFIIEANESTFNTARSSPRPKVDESSSYPRQVHAAYLG